MNTYRVQVIDNHHPLVATVISETIVPEARVEATRQALREGFERGSSHYIRVAPER